MDTSKDTRSKEEIIADLNKKIAYYESKLSTTLDQVDRGIYASKIEAARKQIKELTAKKVNKKVKKRIEDPTFGEKKKIVPASEGGDGRGSVINVGNGNYRISL